MSVRVSKSQVVADEDEREVTRGAEFVEQVHDGLGGVGVEGRGHLVAHEDVGVRRESAGNGGALPPAAGACVRVAVGEVGGKTDLFEKLQHARVPPRTWSAGRRRFA